MNLRRATWADAAYLLRLRNEGEEATWYEGKPTTTKEHERWLALRLNSPLCRIWIVEIPTTNPPSPRHQERIGVVRLDSNDELSVQIDAPYRGKGYGIAAIEAACDQADGRVKACVDATNIEARTAFERAGFKARPDVIFYLFRP